jgi:hypothetical protein
LKLESKKDFLKIQNNTMKKEPMEKGKGEKKVDKKIK